MTDIFPVKISHRVRRLTYPEKNFKYLSENTKVHAFVMYRDSHGKLYYYKKNFLGKYVEHIHFVCRASKHCQEFRPNDVPWPTIAARLRKPVLDHGRKNVDVRAGFKIGNSFLVKAYFTFGIRTVEPGTAHVYQVLNVPLVIYIAPERNGRLLSREERVFPIQDLHLYEKFILLPNRNHKVPAGTTYIIFSVHKNLFQVDKVLENAALPFQTEDPTVTRVRTYGTVYDVPVRTPYIEEEQEDEEAEPSAEPAIEWPVVEGGLIYIPVQMNQLALPADQQEIMLEHQQEIMPEHQLAGYCDQQMMSEDQLAVPSDQQADRQEMMSEDQLAGSCDQQPDQLSLPEEFDQLAGTCDLEATPSDLKRNIVVVSTDFIEQFNSVNIKTFGRPPKVNYRRIKNPLRGMDLSNKGRTETIQLDEILENGDGSEAAHALFSELMNVVAV